MKRYKIITGLLLLSAGIVLAQGSLTPPGAPAPTMKTLDELDASITQLSNAVENIESRIDINTLSGTSADERYISQSGSYYLSSNLVVEKDTGIYVAATNVTIDLNGYGVVRSNGTSGRGIYFPWSQKDGRVFNGSVRFFSTGINASSGCEFEDLLIASCSISGISMPYGSCSIKNCRFLDNPGTGIASPKDTFIRDCWLLNSGESGIDIGAESLIQNCIVRNSGKMGLSCGFDSVVQNCLSFGNGTSGISVSQNSVLSECVSRDNGSTGIGISYGCSMTHCISSGNEGHGIFSSGAGCLIKDCVVQGNEGYGIFLQANSTVKNSIINGNKGSYGIYSDNYGFMQGCCVSYNESDEYMSGGVSLGSSSSIQESVVWGQSNTASSQGGFKGMGILLNKGSAVMDCSISQNQGDGIRAMDNTQIIGNQLNQNGIYGAVGAGIYVINGGTRVENNLITSTDYGITISSSTSTNMANGNSVSGCSVTNYLFYGTVIRGSTVTNTGTIASQQVWDNFDF